MVYAINHICRARKLWQDASPETKILFQKLVFPDGISYDFEKQDFGISKMSPLYTLVKTKQHRGAAYESLMVTLRHPIYKSLVAEIMRWNEFLNGMSWYGRQS